MTKASKDQPAEATAAEPKKCFVMMPISDVPDYPVGHFSEVYSELIEPAVIAAGYSCELATSTKSAHMIQLDVVTKVATADLCICDLSTNNPNVLFEYGIRQAFDLPTVLIKDHKTKRLFDLSGFRDIEYDASLRISKVLAARAEITSSIKQTVDGSNDENQVFSLVKLMKLTKAASIPAGELTKDDARFALIERQLDTLLSMYNASSHRTRDPSGWLERVRLVGDPGASTHDTMDITLATGLGHLNFTDTPEGIRLLIASTGEERLFRTAGELQESDVWKLVPGSLKRTILDRVTRSLRHQ